jgi:hypothetical protein
VYGGGSFKEDIFLRGSNLWEEGEGMLRGVYL